MSDMGEYWNDLKEIRQQEHADRNASATEIILKSGIPHKSTNNGESFLFREPNMPKVDFYPSTGRWRVAGTRKTFNGGVNSFLNWYSKQKE